MKPALFDVTDVDIQNGPYTLRASGEVLKFPGFLSIFQNEVEDEDEEKPENEKALPAMNEGDKLSLLDLETKQPFDAQKERTDSCAVPAAAVVAEAAVAFVLADALLEKTGGDTMDEVLRSLEAYRADLAKY